MSAPARSLPIDNRKDFLLLVLGAPGAASDSEPVLGVTRLQKLLFLAQVELGWDRKYRITSPYEFRPYDYGPFDAQLYEDLDVLEHAGLITRTPEGPESIAEDNESRHLSFEWGMVDPEIAPWEEDHNIYRFELTERGRDFASKLAIEPDELTALASLKREWNSAPLQKLLRWLYNKYPAWATNTKLSHLRPS